MTGAPPSTGRRPAGGADPRGAPPSTCLDGPRRSAATAGRTTARSTRFNPRLAVNLCGRSTGQPRPGVTAWPPARGLAVLVCESTPSPGEHLASPVRFFLAKILHRLLGLVYAPLEGLERCRTTVARAIGRRMPSLGFGAPPPVGPPTPPCGAKANSQASRPPPPTQLRPQSPAQHTSHPPSASNLAGWSASCRPDLPMRRAVRRAAGTRTDRRRFFPATTRE